ncbi:hypothetical protein E4U53_001897 [Claviceps sorghi]|nr:hypothetical protein E4U53_001897 [Claviceps sorghi]
MGERRISRVEAIAAAAWRRTGLWVLELDAPSASGEPSSSQPIRRRQSAFLSRKRDDTVMELRQKRDSSMGNAGGWRRAGRVRARAAGVVDSRRRKKGRAFEAASRPTADVRPAEGRGM